MSEKSDDDKEIESSKEKLSTEEWEERRKTILDIKSEGEESKHQLHCSYCGKAHTSKGKYCEYCGNNLEEDILRFKKQHLPIHYDQSLPTSEKSIEYMMEREKTRRRKSAVAYSITITFIICLVVSWRYIPNTLIRIIFSVIFGLGVIISYIITNTLTPKRSGCGGGYSGFDCSGCDCSNCDNCDCSDCGSCGDCK